MITLALIGILVGATVALGVQLLLFGRKLHPIGLWACVTAIASCLSALLIVLLTPGHGWEIILALAGLLGVISAALSHQWVNR